MSRGPRRAARTADTAPEAAGHRHARLQHLLFDELDAIVRGELADPNLDAVRVTHVELSPDTRNARVWFASEDVEAEEVLRAFERAARFIRLRVADALGIKRVPELRFEHDRYAEARFAAGEDAPSEDLAEDLGDDAWGGEEAEG